MATQEDFRPGDTTPSEQQMARAKHKIGTAVGAAISVPILYGAGVFMTGEWNPLEWGDDFAEWVKSVKLANASPDVVEGAPSETENEVVSAAQAASDSADATVAVAAAAPCAGAAEEIVETVKKVCALPEEALTATADSKCDGVISLTREALLQDTSYVTPEFVASIENPLVKAVYQALLDGDRSALTTALTNLYTENGYFIPENASGTPDGLNDSIIIFNGDQIIIDENGWTLKRAGGETVKLVSCSGELLDVKEEVMSDTGKCGDTKIIPTSELPKEDVEPLCKTGTCDGDAPDTATDRPPTKAEAAAIVNAVSAEDIMAYDNGVLSPELKRLLIENDGSVLTKLYSDSSGASIPFIITEGPVTTEDLSFAARSGYYDVNVGPNGERIYNFNVQRVGADGLERPYCITVTEEQMKLLKRGDLDSIRLESDGYLTLRTPNGLISITDSVAPGKTVRLPEPINGARTAVAQPTAWWESQIQRDAHFGSFKTRG